MIVVLEGTDQAGKKTQAAMLQRALRKTGIKARTFSFPDYTTPIGREIRMHLDGKRRFPHRAIHCLLAANRWEKLGAIQKAQEKNSVLIMNRYYQSNIVYGLVHGIGSDWLENLDSGMPKADLVILLDVTRNESFDRKKSGRDRFEKNRKFLQDVTAVYRRSARHHRWKIIDASRTKQQVHEDVMRAFCKKIGL